MVILSGHLFPTALFWFVMAMLFAAIEIEIEGKHGWAEKTSTWYRTKGLPAKLYGLAMGGKPLTGYHTFMFFLPIFILHSQFVMGVPWSLAGEFMVFALYFVWMPTWDFLWFVLNPYYGVKKFKRENVWWHSKSHWLFNITPLDYLFGWGLSVVLAGVAAWLIGDVSLVLRQLHFMVWFFFFTVITILLFAPLYKRWHGYMRQHDDREASGIFHQN